MIRLLLKSALIGMLIGVVGSVAVLLISRGLFDRGINALIQGLTINFGFVIAYGIIGAITGIVAGFVWHWRKLWIPFLKPALIGGLVGVLFYGAFLTVTWVLYPSGGLIIFLIYFGLFALSGIASGVPAAVFWRLSRFAGAVSIAAGVLIYLGVIIFFIIDHQAGLIMFVLPPIALILSSGAGFLAWLIWLLFRFANAPR